MRGALLVCGTASDAGKSVVTAGICRWLARAGVRVAPFKAQNMANNSAVTAAGAEIGRAQALQAAAAGVEPEAAMNPVLIKPSGERQSQVLVMGRRYADADARSYQDLKPVLREAVLDALADQERLARVRRCPGPSCGWLFLDTSGRRRWCSMSTCGSRVKMRRLYERRRAGEPRQ